MTTTSFNVTVYGLISNSIRRHTKRSKSSTKKKNFQPSFAPAQDIHCIAWDVWVKIKVEIGIGSRRAPPLLPFMYSPPRSRASHSSSSVQNTYNMNDAPHNALPPTPRYTHRQNSRSSTSSESTESGSYESGGSGGFKKKPIPVETFLRT
ncbi:hypothetical protein F4604DRAFT_1929732 [Suillus subluteus]|nr:hypothetical protein F4604DRAFT_1929732 [Suillus subluteus]